LTDGAIAFGAVVTSVPVKHRSGPVPRPAAGSKVRVRMIVLAIGRWQR
jgi:hypothetical protein